MWILSICHDNCVIDVQVFASKITAFNYAAYHHYEAVDAAVSQKLGKPVWTKLGEEYSLMGDGKHLRLCYREPITEKDYE